MSPEGLARLHEAYQDRVDRLTRYARLDEVAPEDDPAFWNLAGELLHTEREELDRLHEGEGVGPAAAARVRRDLAAEAAALPS